MIFIIKIPKQSCSQLLIVIPIKPIIDVDPTRDVERGDSHMKNCGVFLGTAKHQNEKILLFFENQHIYKKRLSLAACPKIQILRSESLSMRKSSGKRPKALTTDT